MTPDEAAKIAEALRQRTTEELARFIEPLLTADSAGVGHYIRAFAAPDCGAAAVQIRKSINEWKWRFGHDTYHQANATSQRLELTLDAIERYVGPREPATAFELVVLFFESDENLGPDDLQYIENEFKRAAALFWKWSKSCQPNRVSDAVQQLTAKGRSGYRDLLRGSTASGE